MSEVYPSIGLTPDQERYTEAKVEGLGALMQRLRETLVCAPGCNGKCAECPEKVARDSVAWIEDTRSTLTRYMHEVNALRLQRDLLEAESVEAVEMLQWLRTLYAGDVTASAELIADRLRGPDRILAKHKEVEF